MVYKTIQAINPEWRRISLNVSYNKLWKRMIDLSMNKTQLRKVAGLSTNVIAKLSKNESVSMDTLLRICKALKCNVGDIVDVMEEYDQPITTEYSFANETNIPNVAEDKTELSSVNKV